MFCPFLYWLNSITLTRSFLTLMPLTWIFWQAQIRFILQVDHHVLQSSGVSRPLLHHTSSRAVVSLRLISCCGFFSLATSCQFDFLAICCSQKYTWEQLLIVFLPLASGTSNILLLLVLAHCRPPPAALFPLPVLFAKLSFCSQPPFCIFDCLPFVIARNCLKHLLYHEAIHVTEIVFVDLHQNCPSRFFDGCSWKFWRVAGRCTHVFTDPASSLTKVSELLSTTSNLRDQSLNVVTLSLKALLHASPIDISAFIHFVDEIPVAFETCDTWLRPRCNFSRCIGHKLTRHTSCTRGRERQGGGSETDRRRYQATNGRRGATRGKKRQ